MRFGMHLPSAGMDVTPDAIVEIACLAEERGYDSVWVNDHAVIPAHFQSRYPFSKDGTIVIDVETPYADALTTLAFAAGVTSRVRLGVSVLVLPYRHPLDTAKKAATLDLLSGGRLILGVGVGWMREEFAAVGVDFDQRRRNFEEQLEIMHAAWTQPTVSFDGEVFSFEAVGVAPHPPRRGGVEVWLGSSAPSVLRRTCRHARAVHWVAEDVTEIARRVSELRRITAEIGLDLRPEVTLRGRIAVADAPSPIETGVLAGPQSYLIETLGEYADIGVSHFLIDRRRDGHDGMRESFDELAPILEALAPAAA